MQRILAGIDTNGDDCGVRLRHGMVLLLLPHTSMLARRAGARPVHPILGHRSGECLMSTVVVISYRQPVEGCYTLPGNLRGAHATARIYHALGWNRGRLAERGGCTKGASPDWVSGLRCGRISQ